MLVNAGTRRDVWTGKEGPPGANAQMQNAMCTLHGAPCTLNGNYNAPMLALRYVYVLALVVWLGGMVLLGAVVAPATFQVLQSIEPIAGRALAGEVFGVTLARFHYV